MPVFYCFRCKHCGNYQVKEIRCVGTAVKLYKRTIKCMKCGKHTTIKKRTTYGLNMDAWGPYDNPQVATKVCQDLKIKQNKEYG